jgi:hypothetical protein
VSYISNALYLVVLPIIHITPTQFTGYGLTEQVLTLLPDKDAATAFFPDEVDTYVEMFKTRANKYLTGGHVTGYECHKEQMGDGRLLVRVTQNVG